MNTASSDTQKVIDPPQHVMKQLMDFADKAHPVEATTRARKLLRNFPRSFLLWSTLGSIESRLGHHMEAETCLKNALRLRPDAWMSHHNLGVCLLNQGKAHRALEVLDEAVKLAPGSALTHYYRGQALAAAGNLPEAEKAYSAAIAARPDFAIAHQERGMMLMQMLRFEAAISALRTAIQYDSNLANAHGALGTLLFDQKNFTQALPLLERALSLQPDDRTVLPLKLNAQAQLCIFSSDGIADVGMEKVPPFTVLSLEDAPENQLKRAVSWWKFRSHGYKPSPLPAQPRTPGEKLRVGYVSADFHEHATLHLMSGLFREHDKSKFEIFAYSHGEPDSSEIRRRLLGDVSVFRDVQKQSDADIAALARADGLDIAIDLKGYTADGRSQLFALRPAPIQINYLGFPGTMGSDAIDYIIADPTIIPAETRPFYSEKVIYMPHSYQPNDDRREIAPKDTRRVDFGLPDHAIVFCCFNRSYKIRPDVFDVWMRILLRIHGSVLWLFRTNSVAENNLRREAEARGVASERLIFANRVPVAEHLARHRHADLFLDTFNYNAHTTASDALWSGLPVVTKCGRQFSARVAASLLNAANLSELIADTPEQYEAKILDLALNPEKLAAVKSRLSAGRNRLPLFDTGRYTRNFECGLQLAYERFRRGLQPADIVIPDVVSSMS